MKAAGRFLLFAATSLLTRGAFLGKSVLDLDEAAHIVGSWELIRGRLLYSDFADNKPPLLYVYYALAQLLAGFSLPAVRFVTALITVPLTAYALSAFFRHDRRGLVAGLLYVVYGAAFLAHDMHAAHAEIVMLLPAMAAVALLRDERNAQSAVHAWGAGTLLGIAALLKYQAAFWLPALAWAIGRARGVPRARNRGALGALVVGFAWPLAATLSVFARSGGAANFVYWNANFVYWNWTHNLHYVANPISASEVLARGAKYFLPFVVVTLPLWWASWRAGPTLDAHERRLLGGVFVSSLVIAVLGFRFFPHYFIPLYAPLSLGAAAWWAPQLRRPLPAPAKILAAYTAAILVTATAMNLWLYGRTDTYEETGPVFRRMAERLREDDCFSNATLFVWGFAPIFYYEARLPVASRFVLPQATLTGYVPGNVGSVDRDSDARSRIETRHWDWLMEDLERNRATYILDTAPSGLHRWQHYPLEGFPRLHAFVREHYERVGSVDSVWIYKRKDCGGASAPRRKQP